MLGGEGSLCDFHCGLRTSRYRESEAHAAVRMISFVDAPQLHGNIALVLTARRHLVSSGLRVKCTFVSLQTSYTQKCHALKLAVILHLKIRNWLASLPLPQWHRQSFLRRKADHLHTQFTLHATPPPPLSLTSPSQTQRPTANPSPGCAPCKNCEYPFQSSSNEF